MNRFSRLYGTVSTLVLALALTGQAAWAADKSFDIPAQPLSKALLQYSQQSDVVVAAPYPLVEGKQAPALKGNMAPDVALDRLLAGSGLRASAGPNGEVMIQPVAQRLSGATPPPRPGEAARVKETQAANPIQTAAAEPTSAAASRSEERLSQVEEVVVTATRRAQNIEDVPISMAVLTAAEIDRRGLINSADYLRSIPGVSQTEGFPGQAVTIRGLETTRDLQNYGSGTTVATYFGETPTSNSAGLGGGSNIDLKVVDIARVEVLRGPQGTSFGDSSMGGAVRTIPVAPKLDRFEGKVAAGYSRTSGTGGDNYNVQAIGNIPLVADKLALRVTGYQDRDDGFYRNRAASDSTFAARAVTPYGAQAFALDKEHVGSHAVVGARAAALFQGSDDFRFTATYVKQKTEINGPPVATSGGYDQTTLQVAPEHVVRGQTGGASDTDIDLVNALAEFKLSWADLLASYSYVSSTSTQAYQYTYINSLFPASFKADSRHLEHIGELRLVTNFSGPWNFIAGLYIQRVRDKEFNDYLWYGTPATSIFRPQQRALGTFFDRRTLTQKAAYGEASWEIVPRLVLTGGVRGYKYDRTFHYDADGTPFFGAAGVHVLTDTGVSGATGRVNLSYKITDDALVYGGWSQGFRLGQLQRGVPPGTCDLNNDGVIDGTNITVASTRKLNSDTVENFEVGGKFATHNRRLMVSADAFHMNWSGMPIRAIAPCSGVTQSYTANAGSSTSQGVEFQANVRVTDAIRLDVGGSYVDAKLSEAIGQPLNAPKGTRLPSPKVNANLGLEYGFQVAGYQTFLRTDVVYVGPFSSTVSLLPNTVAGDYVRIDLSARVEVRNFNVTLFVDNLGNEDAFTYRYSSNLGPLWGSRLQPRTIGLRAGYSF